MYATKPKKPELDWHVLCNVKKDTDLMAASKWIKCFGLHYAICFDLSHIDRRNSMSFNWITEAKNICRVTWREMKLLWVSRRFKLSRFWGTRGKIAVNIWWKSREKSILVWVSTLGSTLMRVWVIGSQLYTIKFVVRRIFVLWRWQRVRRAWILSDYT